MSPYPPTQAQEIDKLKCASIEHVSDIILQVPTMSSSLISALEISQLDLDAKQLVQWRTAFENEKQRYPQHAWELLDALIRKSIEVGGTLMAILGNCDYQEMARGFRVCHARAEILRGGSGRKLAGKIAMRALRYPIANYWVFTEEPLCEILKHEHPLGFEVEVEGGYLPWVPAWVLAVLESDVQNHDVGAQAVFERLLSSGADVEEDIPGGDGGLALTLATQALEQGNSRADVAVQLLMGAGASWTHLNVCPGSRTEEALGRWPQFRRARLQSLCGPGFSKDSQEKVLI